MQNRLRIAFPSPVVSLISALEQAGFEAYAVGGCVRDSLLGNTPADWDLCTSALPDEICASFADYPLVRTGMRHGTIAVIIDKKPFEITTYRVDGEYSDHRRPDRVCFSASLRADLARRDFTINAMACHPQKGLVDVFHGEADLQAGVIRCIGKADKRFQEDALRILRALRFASAYGFSIEQQTSCTLHSHAPLLARVAIERVSDELCKLLAGKAAQSVLLEFADVLGAVIPGLAARMQQPDFSAQWKQSVAVIAQAAQNLPIALAELASLSVKPDCITVKPADDSVFAWCSALRLDKQTAKQVALLVRNPDMPPIAGEVELKRLMYRIGVPQTDLLLTAARMRMLAKGNVSAADRMQSAREQMVQLIGKKVCFNLEGLAINGNDLKEMGITDGKMIGKLLDRMVTAVINGEVENKKNLLLEHIMIEKHKNY